jgi:hydrogenase small subunit
MPGFPDRFMPFMEPNPLGLLASAGARYTWGPVMRRLRRSLIEHRYDREPSWRARSRELTTGYERRW